MRNYNIKYAVFLLIIFLLPCFIQTRPLDTWDKLAGRLTGLTGKERIPVLVKIIKLLVYRNPQKAIEYGRETLQLLDKYPDVKLSIAVLNALNKALEMLGDFSLAEKYSREALDLARASGDKLGQVYSLLGISQVYYGQARYREALDKCMEAEAILKDSPDQYAFAHILVLRAQIFIRTGDFFMSLDLLFKANSIFEIYDEHHDIGRIKRFIGICYNSLGEQEKAYSFLSQAIDIFLKSGNKVDLAITYNSLGIYSFLSKKPTQSLEFYEKALSISREIQLKQLYSYILNNMGEVYEVEGQATQAMTYYQDSLAIKKKLNDRMAIAYTLINIANIYRTQGNYQQALSILEEALDISLNLNLKNELVKTYSQFFSIFQAQGNYRSALAYLKLYKKNSDLIFNSRQRQRICTLQANYDLQAKDKEIQLRQKEEYIRRLELEQRRNQKNILVVIFLTVLSLLAFIYARFRLKVKSNRLLRLEIADHKSTAQKLQDSEEKFRSLVEKSNAAIVIIQDNAFQYINPCFHYYFGISFERFSPQFALDRFARDPNSDDASTLESMIANVNTHFKKEFKLIHPSGNTYYLEGYFTSIVYRGKPALLGEFNDISHRKMKESELLESKKMEAVGRFAGGIAHDFNNLFSVIIGYLGMIKDTLEIHPRLKDKIIEAENASLKAVDLSSQVIVFALKERESLNKKKSELFVRSNLIFVFFLFFNSLLCFPFQ